MCACPLICRLQPGVLDPCRHFLVFNFFFFFIRTFDLGWIQVSCFESFSSCCFDCIRNEAESSFLNLCSIFFQKSVLHSCAFHVFSLVPRYLCGDYTWDHLKITVVAEYGWVLTYVTASFNFHLQCQLAASLKMLLLPSKNELSSNFSRTLSPFSLLYLLLFIFCAQVKQQTTLSRKWELVHKWINLVYTKCMPRGLTFRFILWSYMKLSYTYGKIS